MKKILCNNSEVQRVFAHVLDDGTIDIVRQDQRFTIIGETFTLIGTNPQGDGKTVLQVVGGKLVDEDLKYKEDNPDGKENNNGQERQEENDNGGRPNASGEPDGSAQPATSGEPDANGSPDSGQAGGGTPADGGATPANGSDPAKRTHIKRG